MNTTLQFYHHEWKIDNPKANIILVHGLGEHIQRYDEWSLHFNSLGYSVYGFDQLGHGKSGGKRGHIASYDSTYSVLDQLIQRLGNNLPLFIYGHSFGGNMLLNYAVDQKPAVTGYIASAPFIKAGTPISPILLFIGRLMSYIYPSLQLDNGLDLNNLSTDSEIIERYKQDALVHSKVSAGLAANMIDKAEKLVEFDGHLSAPLLMMHGEKDIITGPDGSKLFSENIQSDVTMNIIPDDFHEIHNGIHKNAVWKMTADWMANLAAQ